MKIYNDIEVKIQLDYKNDSLYFKDCLFKFNGKVYQSDFVKPINEKIKLDIKINDDIFHPIKLED